MKETSDFERGLVGTFCTLIRYLKTQDSHDCGYDLRLGSFTEDLKVVS